LLAVYQAQMAWILQEDILNSTQIFIKNGAVLGPKEDYGEQMVDEGSGI